MNHDLSKWIEKKNLESMAIADEGVQEEICVSADKLARCRLVAADNDKNYANLLNRHNNRGGIVKDYSELPVVLFHGKQEEDNE